jgi:predicted nucleic-acid-binding protein
MIGIDTNVLVRVLVEDTEQPHQTQLARALVRSVPQVYVSQIVQVETVWVLESAYQFDKASIIRALEQLSQNEALVLQHADNFLLAVELYRQTSADFADCLILVDHRQLQVPLYTFDKRLSRQIGAKLLK